MDEKYKQPPSYDYNPSAPMLVQPMPQQFQQAPQQFQQAPQQFQQAPQQFQQQPLMTVIAATPFGTDPTTAQCPSCRTSVITRVDFKTTTQTHMMALITCILCCPCAWIPYVVNSCQSAHHYCPSCGCYLGRQDH